MHKEVILSQEAGEEHAVPVFVGGLCDEPVDALDPGLRVQCISKLARMGPQTIAKEAVSWRNVSVRLARVNGELFERYSRAILSDVSRRDHRGFQLLAQGLW
jgi:hypothetical protein